MRRSGAARTLLVLSRWSLAAALIGAGALMYLATPAGVVPIAAGLVLVGTPCAVRVAHMDVHRPGGLLVTSRSLVLVALPGLVLLTAALLLLVRG